MEVTLIAVGIAFVELVLIIVLLKVCNESSKRNKTLKQINLDFADQVAILKNQLEVARQPVKAEDAYAAFRESNKVNE